MADLSPSEAAAVAAAEQEFHGTHSPAHNTANPMAVPQNGNLPAGWVSAEQHEAQQRQMHREQIMRERADADAAALEMEVQRRMLVASGGMSNGKEDEVNDGK